MSTASNLKAPIATLLGFVFILGCTYGFALEEVADPSRSLLRLFWISLAGTVDFAVAALVVTRYRGFCARLADVEDFISQRFFGKCCSKRGLESRACKIGTYVFFGIFALLTLVIGGTYLHFRSA
jgi:hypothetical protein